MGMGNMGWDEGGEYGEGTMGMGVGEMSNGIYEGRGGGGEHGKVLRQRTYISLILTFIYHVYYYSRSHD
jgi:hypothetical protein